MFETSNIFLLFPHNLLQYCQLFSISMIFWGQALKQRFSSLESSRVHRTHKREKLLVGWGKMCDVIEGKTARKKIHTNTTKRRAQGSGKFEGSQPSTWTFLSGVFVRTSAWVDWTQSLGEKKKASLKDFPIFFFIHGKICVKLSTKTHTETSFGREKALRLNDISLLQLFIVLPYIDFCLFFSLRHSQFPTT